MALSIDYSCGKKEHLIRSNNHFIVLYIVTEYIIYSFQYRFIEDIQFSCEMISLSASSV